MGSCFDHEPYWLGDLRCCPRISSLLGCHCRWTGHGDIRFFGHNSDHRELYLCTYPSETTLKNSNLIICTGVLHHTPSRSQYHSQCLPSSVWSLSCLLHQQLGRSCGRRMDIRHDGILRCLLLRIHRSTHVEGTQDQGMDSWGPECLRRRREGRRLQLGERRRGVVCLTLLSRTRSFLESWETYLVIGYRSCNSFDARYNPDPLTYLFDAEMVWMLLR